VGAESGEEFDAALEAAVSPASVAVLAGEFPLSGVAAGLSEGGRVAEGGFSAGFAASGAGCAAAAIGGALGVGAGAAAVEVVSVGSEF
jgi:hypothetical protein